MIQWTVLDMRCVPWGPLIALTLRLHWDVTSYAHVMERVMRLVSVMWTLCRLNHKLRFVRLVCYHHTCDSINSIRFLALLGKFKGWPWQERDTFPKQQRVIIPGWTTSDKWDFWRKAKRSMELVISDCMVRLVLQNQINLFQSTFQYIT